MDPGYLDSIADLYKSCGYRVFSNVFGDSQMAVKGTETISLPADVLLSVIRRGVSVIGVQCGLLDACEWMHLTNKIIKVYLLETEKDEYHYSNRTNTPDQKIEKKNTDTP